MSNPNDDTNVPSGLSDEAQMERTSPRNPDTPAGPLLQGGFSWRSPRRPPSLLCARSPPYVLPYVLLLVQMAGGGPLMRIFFISVCYL